MDGISESKISFKNIKKEVKKSNLKKRVLIVLESTTHVNWLSVLAPSRKNSWFWFTIGFTVLALLSIILLPESGTPLSYLRYVFGFVLAAFLPGYCLTQALFPKKTSIDEIERFAFSIGLSFAVTALVGLFLSFTPFRLTLTTALLTLDLVIVFLAIVALQRKSKSEE